MNSLTIYLHLRLIPTFFLHYDFYLNSINLQPLCRSLFLALLILPHPIIFSQRLIIRFKAFIVSKEVVQAHSSDDYFKVLLELEWRSQCSIFTYD